MATTLQNLSDSELIEVANQQITAMNTDPAAYGTTPQAVAALGVLVGITGSITYSSMMT